VFKTTTGGSGGTGSPAWQDISAGLPDAPVGSGLPLVPVADLDAVASRSATVLTAATYGLGFYRTTA
jgi:hypothetical protein